MSTVRAANGAADNATECATISNTLGATICDSKYPAVKCANFTAF